MVKGHFLMAAIVSPHYSYSIPIVGYSSFKKILMRSFEGSLFFNKSLKQKFNSDKFLHNLNSFSMDFTDFLISINFNNWKNVF